MPYHLYHTKFVLPPPLHYTFYGKDKWAFISKAIYYF